MNSESLSSQIENEFKARPELTPKELLKLKPEWAREGVQV